MKPALRVLSPGLSTTVQDLGRPGHQWLGIPVGGALDPVSLRAANALVGNPPDTGALEVLYLGPRLAVEADSIRMSFAGADPIIEVLAGADAAHGTLVETMRSIRLQRGAVIRIGRLARSSVLYIAVEGGFAIEPVLGSVSTCVRGRLGGWDGRALVDGDRLPLRRMSASNRDDCRLQGMDLSVPARLRVIEGPQNDYFSKPQVEAFFANEYTVSAGSDRMGMRLSGPKVEHARGFDIVSDGIAPGSIQISGSGQPIVLLADRQTTGGYPKIATVISADLPALGRLPIGAKITFERVGLHEAEALRRKLLADIDGIATRLRAAQRERAARAEPPRFQSDQRRDRRPQCTRVMLVSQSHFQRHSGAPHVGAGFKPAPRGEPGMRITQCCAVESGPAIATARPVVMRFRAPLTTFAAPDSTDGGISSMRRTARFVLVGASALPSPRATQCRRPYESPQ